MVSRPFQGSTRATGVLQEGSKRATIRSQYGPKKAPAFPSYLQDMHKKAPRRHQEGSNRALAIMFSPCSK
eukprot:4197094-Pyramimonas_sp.AAC.1